MSGTRVPRRRRYLDSLRVLRYGAVALAVLGLLALWVAARHADVPPIRVQDVEATMNWAYVRLHGTVTDYPVYDERTGRLWFWLDDGTGQIMVISYGNQGRALIEAGGVPAIGDRVDVRGTLKDSEDFLSLTLNVPEHLVVERPAPVEVPIAAIAVEHLYQKVQVHGQVRRVSVPYEGLTLLVVRDATGEIDVTYSADLIRLSGEPIVVGPGDSVSVRGVVTQYRGTPQIALDGAQGVQRLPEQVAIAPHRWIAEVDSADIDRLVWVEGAIAELRSMSAGLQCVLDDGTGEIAVVLWKDLLEGVATRLDLRVGSWLNVQGVVAEYRGKLELIPELALDVRGSAVPQSAAQPTPVRTSTPTLNLPACSLDTPSPAVSVPPTCTVAAPRDVAGLTRDMAHKERGAPIVTPTASPTLAHADDSAELAAGSVVSAAQTGRGASNELGAPTATPGIPTDVLYPLLSTGGLTAAHVGLEVMIQGTIEETIGFSSGVKSYVDDGSGRIAVWMPQAFFVQLPNVAGWIVGSTVQVRGRVQVYGDEIEVVPQGASDADGDIGDGPPVVILTVATPSPEVITRIGDLSVAQKGVWVTVEGRILEVYPFSEGIKYSLDDGSGQIALLLWQNVHDVVPDKEQLTIGATVRATGRVDEYRGELEVIPSVGGDVLLGAPVESP